MTTFLLITVAILCAFDIWMITKVRETNKLFLKQQKDLDSVTEDISKCEDDIFDLTISSNARKMENDKILEACKGYKEHIEQLETDYQWAEDNICIHRDDIIELQEKANKDLSLYNDYGYLRQKVEELCGKPKPEIDPVENLAKQTSMMDTMLKDSTDKYMARIKELQDKGIALELEPPTNYIGEEPILDIPPVTITPEDTHVLDWEPMDPDEPAEDWTTEIPKFFKRDTDEQAG